MIVFGKQVFFHILKHHKYLVRELFLAKEVDKTSFALIAKSGFRVKKLDFKAAQALARGGNHQGFLLEIKDFEFSPLNEIKNEQIIAMFCGISDVGNIGAMIRTAYALGLCAVVIEGKSLAMENIIRSSSGAALDVKIHLSQDILSTLNELKQCDFRLYASAKEGKDVSKLKFEGKRLLIMGSEGLGLSKKIIARCDDCLGIKMKNDFDSLNVSAAFAILCDRMVNE